MSEHEREKAGPDADPEDGSEPGGGVNLTLVYSLIALAFVAAFVIAAYIVLPFYHRR